MKSVAPAPEGAPLAISTLGAAASSAPDLEHVLPFLRPRGRKLFHYRGWHRSGRFPAGAQLLLAGAILGALIAPGSRALRQPQLYRREEASNLTVPGRESRPL